MLLRGENIMLKGKILRKSWAVVIVILFFGAGVIPSISGNIEKINSVTFGRELLEGNYGSNKDENDAELPIWKVGDSWTYKVEIEGGQDSSIDFDISIDNLKLEVIEVQNEAYKLDMAVPIGDITGSGSVDLDIITLQGKLINTKMDGTVYVDKSTLEIIESEAIIDGYIDKIVDIPFTVNIYTSFYDLDTNRTNFSSLKFPLNIGSKWTVPFTHIVSNLTVNLLPEPTSMFLYVDEHEFNCTGWETVEVGEVEYDALKISGNFGNKNNIWYSVAAGNIVKIDYESIDMGYGFKLKTLEMTLISTTYQVPTNPPNTPSTPSGPTTLSVGESGAYSSSATDPDGDKIKYIFDWDDGTKTHTDFQNSGEPATVSHTWIRKGNYSVRVKARDKYGGESEWSDPLSVTILNTAPDKPSTPSGPTSGKIKKSYTYSTSTIDPDGHRVKYGWDWNGDGTVDKWTGLLNSSETASASHTWNKRGNYEIKVKARDEYGEESIWSDPLPISMPKNIQLTSPLLMQFLQRFIERFPLLERLPDFQ
jgi:hypothetical protein